MTNTEIMTPIKPSTLAIVACALTTCGSLYWVIARALIELAPVLEKISLETLIASERKAVLSMTIETYRTARRDGAIFKLSRKHRRWVWVLIRGTVKDNRASSAKAAAKAIAISRDFSN